MNKGNETWMYTMSYAAMEERMEAHLLSFPGLPVLTISSYGDATADTAILRLRYRGGRRARRSLERWALMIGFQIIDSSRWNRGKRRDFVNDLRCFETSALEEPMAASLSSLSARLVRHSKRCMWTEITEHRQPTMRSQAAPNAPVLAEGSGQHAMSTLAAGLENKTSRCRRHCLQPRYMANHGSPTNERSSSSD